MALDRKARESLADTSGLTTHDEYEALLDEIATQRVHKVIGYGEERYRTEAWTEEEDVWMLWSDVFRKYIRLRQLRNAMDLDGLREVLKDMANYCIMGMQIIDRRKQK